MKKRILFVDDEPRVLQALQRMLRTMRHEWDMAFATSGREALDILSKTPFDVLVSDMRMPEMDGAQLLDEVAKHYPGTVRIVLSGHSAQEMVLRSVKHAHQYLSKPCDAETLKATVGRATALCNFLNDNGLREAISRLDSLPSLPSLYLELVEHLQSPDASVRGIGDIISRDPGMTAKILQLVNSAFFGLRREISSPAQAVTLLGVETVKDLVLAVQVFSRFDGKGLPENFLNTLWSHSLATGVMARTIAKTESDDQSAVDNAFTAGLLHDVGKLVLGVNFPAEYGEIKSRIEHGDCQQCEVENKVLGTTHEMAGAYLVQLWGLPASIVEAIAFHHFPGKSLVEGFHPLVTVHVANCFEHDNASATTKKSSYIDTGYLEQIGLLERIPEWRSKCSQIIGEVKANE